MIVQRYEHGCDGIVHAVPNGTYVLYSDHVAVMLALEEQIGYLKSHRDEERAKGATNERFRIRQEVMALRKNYYGEELDLEQIKGYLLSVIDGEQ